MRRLYKTLLRLYPRDYTELFAAEMLAAFEEVSEERQRQGAAVFLRFAIAELMGLVTGAVAELIAKSVYAVYHNNSYISGRCLPHPCGYGLPASVESRTSPPYARLQRPPI
jgi:hypothetical protein